MLATITALLMATPGPTVHHRLFVAAQYRFENPESDAANALAAGDSSLIGIPRFAVEVAGVDGDYEILRHRYEIRIIEGTSDVIDERPDSFDMKIEQYGTRYNRFILKALGCNFQMPMEPCSPPANSKRP